MKLLGQAEVARNLPPLDKAIEIAAGAYAQGPEEGLEIPPKVAVHPRAESFMHAMPCYMGASDLLGVKWIGGFERNREKGLPYINGVLILSDPDTGQTRALLDAAPITVSRTVAASAVCLRAWAAAEVPSAVGVLGCGVQGAAHAQALAELAPGAPIAVFDPAGSRLRALGIAATAAAAPAEVFAGAEVVVTAAPMRGPDRSAGLEAELFDRERWLALPLDMDASLGPGVSEAADLFTVDDVGQYQHYREAGYFRGWRKPDGSVADLLGGRLEPGRRTLAVNLGVSSLDLAFGDYVVSRARERGDGLEVEAFGA